MFRRKWRREYERNRTECFGAAMVIADQVAMRFIPDEESVERYRKAERAFVNGPRPEPGRRRRR